MSEKQYIIFDLGQEEYGIEITLVQEIIRMPKVTKLPNTPSYILGITNLRGKILSILDLSKRLNLQETENTENTRIIVVKIKDQAFGIKVNAVNEVLSINAEAIEGAQEISTSVDHAYICGVAKFDERLILILDILNII